MILEIKQISANGNNSFEIMYNNTLCYYAQSPWFPMITDSTRKIVLKDKNGNIMLETRYHLLDNMFEAAIPMKYLVTGKQIFDQYQITDTSGNVIGVFYVEQNRIADWKICMTFNGHVIVGYRRSIGYSEIVSFYENELQVGQLTKSNKVVNNLDQYYVHFLDGYEEWLPVLSIFTVYYDYLFHNNSGEIMKGTVIEKNFTYDRNNNKYNKNFIVQHFGEAENSRIANIMNQKVELKIGNMSIKTFWIIFGVGWGVAIVIAIVIFLLVFM